nr:hypothetical protein [Stenotrophomonas geniculata]
MHLTETARTFCLTGPVTEAGTVAKTATEATQVSFDGGLCLQHAKPGQVIEVRGEGLQGPAASRLWVCAIGGVAGLPLMGEAFGNKAL